MDHPALLTDVVGSDASGDCDGDERGIVFTVSIEVPGLQRVSPEVRKSWITTKLVLLLVWLRRLALLPSSSSTAATASMYVSSSLMIKAGDDDGGGDGDVGERVSPGVSVSTATGENSWSRMFGARSSLSSSIGLRLAACLRSRDDAFRTSPPSAPLRLPAIRALAFFNRRERPTQVRGAATLTVRPTPDFYFRITEYCTNLIM